MILPLHRRYQWRILSRNLRLKRKAWMLAAAVIVGYIVSLNLDILELTVAKLRAENQTRTMLAVQLRPHPGAPVAHADLELESTWRDAK